MSTWEKRAEWPLMFFSLLFLTGYAWPILDPEINPVTRDACEIAQFVAWIAFAIDYGVRLWLADARWQFVRANLLDLLMIALPLLRPLRLLRLVVLLRVVNRTATSTLRGRFVTYVVGGSTLLSIVGGLAILDVERGASDSNIRTIGDAMWWAATTMTTVGYGDLYPTTGLGRWVAVGLMVSGIGILGTVTAALASWLTERIREETVHEEDTVLVELRAVRTELESLRARLPNEET